MKKKILLLGSGELGKELVIALKRLGQTVIAVDSYAHAPAMQDIYRDSAKTHASSISDGNYTYRQNVRHKLN